MSYSVSTQSALNGNFKQTHLKKLENLVNEDTHLFRDIPFDESQKEGALFRQPVYLTRPHGITFSASDAAPTLASPIAAETKELSFDAYQMIMRDRVSYDAADRMKSKESYISATGELPMWLRLSHIHYAELMLWYGQSDNGIGTVASINGNVLTITTAEWAPQIWQGSENMRLDDYTSTTFVKTMQVTAYDLDSMTVTVDSAAGVTAGDVLHPSGSFGNSYRGVFDIITESTSQFGQNPSTYNLLKGVQQSAGTATLKFKIIQYGLAKARAKGLSKRAKLYCSEFTFPDFIDEVDAARTDPQRAGELRGSTIERGADNVKIHSPNGTLEVQVSSYCKKGYAPLLIQDGSWTRKGTSDVTFKIPGSKGDEFYLHLQEVAGYELRSWSNFANYTPRAGSNTLFTGIKNGIDGGT